MKCSLSSMRQKLEKIYEGGGKKAMAKQKEKNKLTPRERISYLTDSDKPFIEIGAFAGFEMYEEQGGCPAGGTVAGIGYVSGRQCVIVANDQTVKAGAWFPITGKKNLRLQEIAMENHLPVIYLVDSAGVFLPMQDEIFPDKEHFGRIFRNNARYLSMCYSSAQCCSIDVFTNGCFYQIRTCKKNGTISFHHQCFITHDR